jgi:trans-aconitate methyltransferase
MRLISQSDVDDYLVEDSLSVLLNSLSGPEDRELTCQRWLQESAPKRCVFEALYGDLLLERKGLRVLDVGGGLTAFTTELANRHDYSLVDLFAHDDEMAISRLGSKAGSAKIFAEDWHDFCFDQSYDVVVANDLFPNVDQRLELFLARFVPLAGELRLALTYYDTPRFYAARRISGEEIFFMLAWNAEQTRRVLEPYAQQIRDARLDMLGSENVSVYPNGRQVCLLTISGGRES